MAEDGTYEARVFAVETRFQRMARRPGGVPREQAIEQAWAQVEENKPGFDDWVNKELQSLTDVVASARPGANKEWAEMAVVHSRRLRDVGTTMGFELLTFVADSLCDVLDAIAAGAEYSMETIACHVDALFLARQRAFRGVKPDQVPELTSGLRRIVDQVNTSPG
ncbi:MAG TPA: hypothetical protein VG986_16400 [Pseudolabrys sp.]|nr:hypothetical protein [Pseudolabrys sp.]